MDKDDIIYITFLIACIVFGYFTKKIKNPEEKQLIGTLLGFFIVISISGFSSFHILFSSIVASLIIIYGNVRNSHIYTFVFMFGYLLFFRISSSLGLPEPAGHANLIQMILTLKIVGLGFERNEVYKKLLVDKDSQLNLVEQDLLKIDILKIYHYCFNYNGLLAGPYFTYKTYHDYIHLPFSSNVDSVKATIAKMKMIPLYAGLFLICNYIWPLEYAISHEFYNERSWMYRLWYIWPRFFIFRMRIYTGIILSECVCTMSGLGCYPEQLHNKPGHGPSSDPENSISENNLAYNFETIRNIDVYATEKCLSFREAMKSWNMCVQYWLAIYIYKKFPNKKLRTIATLAVSAFWHGVAPGYYFCIFAAPFYMPVDDLCTKVLRDNSSGFSKTIKDAISWVFKFFAFSYMGIAFQFKTFERIFHFYKSVYFSGHIMWLLMFAGFFSLLKFRKMKH